MQSDIESLFLYKIMILAQSMSCGTIPFLQHLTQMSWGWLTISVQVCWYAVTIWCFPVSIVPMFLLNYWFVSMSFIVSKGSTMLSGLSINNTLFRHRMKKCWTHLPNLSFLLCDIFSFLLIAKMILTFLLVQLLFYSFKDWFGISSVSSITNTSASF